MTLEINVTQRCRMPQSGLTLDQGATANFSLNSSDARMLDQVQMRVLDQEDATFRSGTRYPIVTSTYSNLTGTSLGIGGISTPGLSSALQNLGISSAALQSTTSQTIPQVQYEDLGLTLKATPHILQNQDVTLKIDLKIESLSGQTLNSNPVLNSRQYQGSITLLPGESSEIVSRSRCTDAATASGYPVCP